MARARGRGRRELKSEINIVPLLPVGAFRMFVEKVILKFRR